MLYCLRCHMCMFSTLLPGVCGLWVVRIDPLRFLAGCRTSRRLNQALSALSLSVVFLSVSVVLLTRAPFCVVLFCVICAFFRFLVVLVRLSVPVQVIDWKRLVYEMTYNALVWTLNPTHYSLAQHTVLLFDFSELRELACWYLAVINRWSTCRGS